MNDIFTVEYFLQCIRDFVSPLKYFYWLNLLSFITIAYAIYLLRDKHTYTGKGLAGFVRYLFPPDIYKHSSAWVDARFVLLNIFLFPIISGPILISGEAALRVGRSFWQMLGVPHLFTLEGMWVSVTYTLVVLIALDLGLYLAHYLQHKIPVLWEFHKVHHSAEVLTPLTALRMHPIDDFLSLTLTICFSAAVGSLFDVAAGGLPMITVFGGNLFLFIFYFLGSHFRHSHIWLSYGPVFSKIFISPAQHQVHHSAEERHWDKNMGFIFAFWDYLFGTLYIPKQKEEFALGVAGEDGTFSGAVDLYVRPFLRASRFKKRKSP